MKVEGVCHCGRIAYEAEVDPAQTGMCHCIDCQIFSGSPFRASVPASAGDFHLLRGTPKIYVKIADSGAKRAQAFCGDCGSPIYATDPENPVKYNLRVGAIKQRAQIAPQRQIWCDSALAWAQNVSEIPGRPKG